MCYLTSMAKTVTLESAAPYVERLQKIEDLLRFLRAVPVTSGVEVERYEAAVIALHDDRTSLLQNFVLEFFADTGPRGY